MDFIHYPKCHFAYYHTYPASLSCKSSNTVWCVQLSFYTHRTFWIYNTMINSIPVHQSDVYEYYKITRIIYELGIPAHRHKAQQHLACMLRGVLCGMYLILLIYNIQCGAVITRSILSQIFTKDTPWLAR